MEEMLLLPFVSLSNYKQDHTKTTRLMTRGGEVEHRQKEEATKFC